MHCTVGGSGVKVLARALQSLARLGKDFIYVEPANTFFCMRTINSSHSAFGVFQFPLSFFVKYWVETEVDPTFNTKLLHCRLSVKSVQGIVRSLNVPKHVESCTFTIKQDEDRVKVELNCRFKVVKVQFLPVVAWETVELQMGQTPDMSNHFTATAKQFTDVLINFYPNPVDITIIVTAQNLWLQNFIDGARDPKKERRTEMILNAGEFYDYHIDEKSQVTFNVKDWKAILSFAGAFTLPVSVNFQKAGRPVVFKVEREGLFEAKYILATVLPLNNVPAGEDNIPDSALVISKKLSEKHKNVSLYKALEKKRMTTLNIPYSSKTAVPARKSHHENVPDKKAASESAAFCTSEISSLEILNEWLPEEIEINNDQNLNKKRNFNRMEAVNGSERPPVLQTKKVAASDKAFDGEVETNFGHNPDVRLNKNSHNFVNNGNELDCEIQRGIISSNCTSVQTPVKRSKICSSVMREKGDRTPSNSQLTPSRSCSEKIHTVFRCCFLEPFDITKLPGYDDVLAEDSDGESCR